MVFYGTGGDFCSYGGIEDDICADDDGRLRVRRWWSVVLTGRETSVTVPNVPGMRFDVVPGLEGAEINIHPFDVSIKIMKQGIWRLIIIHVASIELLDSIRRGGLRASNASRISVPRRQFSLPNADSLLVFWSVS